MEPHEENSLIWISIPDWLKIVDRQKTFDPKIFVEIGSFDAADSYSVSQHYQLDKVIIIEPHPTFFKKIKENHPDFLTFDFAASDKDGTCDFNAIREDSANLGISSILDRSERFPAHGCTGYEKIKVTTKRFDTFMKEQEILEIDLLKIDVEGNSFEVLSGFGDMLKHVKCIHVENEHLEIWKNQFLYKDVEKLLVEAGFVLLIIRVGWPQSDSVWIRKDLVKNGWWIQ